eukprot:Lankesteria_metandrocarpae@DN5467_c0_g1_i2.p1
MGYNKEPVHENDIELMEPLPCSDVQVTTEDIGDYPGPVQQSLQTGTVPHLQSEQKPVTDVNTHLQVLGAAAAQSSIGYSVLSNASQSSCKGDDVLSGRSTPVDYYTSPGSPQLLNSVILTRALRSVTMENTDLMTGSAVSTESDECSSVGQDDIMLYDEELELWNSSLSALREVVNVASESLKLFDEDKLLEYTNSKEDGGEQREQDQAWKRKFDSTMMKLQQHGYVDADFEVIKRPTPKVFSKWTRSDDSSSIYSGNDNNESDDEMTSKKERDDALTATVMTLEAELTILRQKDLDSTRRVAQFELHSEELTSRFVDSSLNSSSKIVELERLLADEVARRIDSEKQQAEQ